MTFLENNSTLAWRIPGETSYDFGEFPVLNLQERTKPDYSLNDLNEQDAIAKKKTSSPPPNLPIFKRDDIGSEEKFMEISSLFDYESKINELKSEFEMMPQTLETLKKRKMMIRDFIDQIQGS